MQCSGSSSSYHDTTKPKWLTYQCSKRILQYEFVSPLVQEWYDKKPKIGNKSLEKMKVHNKWQRFFRVYDCNASFLSCFSANFLELSIWNLYIVRIYECTQRNAAMHLMPCFIKFSFLRTSEIVTNYQQAFVDRCRFLDTSHFWSWASLM